jgi:hypothetical protein
MFCHRHQLTFDSEKSSYECKYLLNLLSVRKIYLKITFSKITVRIRVTLLFAVYRQSFRLGDKPLETHEE